jgi:hypothetical protein
MRMRNLLVTAAAVPALMLTMAGGTAFPSSIPLPDDFAPEGIAVGRGNTFFTGSLHDGDIYRGNLRTGEGRVIADVSGRSATGMKVAKRWHRLYVGGAITGDVYAYDTRNGGKRGLVHLATPGQALINDLVKARRALYVTETFNPVLYKVRLKPGGAFGTSRAIQVKGEGAQIVDGFGLNGIDATPNGKRIIVGHTGLGQLFRFNRHTGMTHRIRIPGTPFPPSIDGILLDRQHHTWFVWVVANFSNTVLKVKLSDNWRRGRIVERITNQDVDGLFRVPTTVAEKGDRLVLPNSRFDLGFPPPLGPGAPPGTDYDVVQIPKDD